MRLGPQRLNAVIILHKIFLSGCYLFDFWCRGQSYSSNSILSNIYNSSTDCSILGVVLWVILWRIGLTNLMWTGVFFRVLGAVSSETWPAVWIMIETNLISFLPLLGSKSSIKKNCLLYFIVQSVGSLALLLGGLLYDWRVIFGVGLLFGLLLKARLAPFHFWGGAIICKITIVLGFTFLTWQKLIPLFMILIRTNNGYVNVIILVNVFIGALRRLGTKDLLHVLFFSGLLHSGWTISPSIVGASIYFLLYCLISAPIFNSPNTTNLSILILNIAGIPPMTGFFIKLEVLQIVRYGLGVALILSSLFMLYTYARTFLNKTPIGKFNLITLFICSIGPMII